jgi:hypothetical protein
MSVSGISNSSAAFPQPSAQQSQFRQNFSALSQAIQSGNLADAQQAYATLTQSMPNNNPNSPFAQALAQIGSALQSGNIAGAQQALSTMQAHGHHRHHGGGSGQNGSPSNSSATISSSSLVGAASGGTDVSA